VGLVLGREDDAVVLQEPPLLALGQRLLLLPPLVDVLGLGLLLLGRVAVATLGGPLGGPLGGALGGPLGRGALAARLLLGRRGLAAGLLLAGGVVEVIVIVILAIRVLLLDLGPRGAGTLPGGRLVLLLLLLLLDLGLCLLFVGLA